MSNWDRREAETLASALQKHIAAVDSNAPGTARLKVILVEANYAAKSFLTTRNKSTELRNRVCAICRANQLYDCDVPSGWSMNCEIIACNETRYADL